MPKLSHPMQIRYDAMCEIADLLVHDQAWGSKIKGAIGQNETAFVNLDLACKRFREVTSRSVSANVDQWIMANFPRQYLQFVISFAAKISEEVKDVSPSFAHALAAITFNLVIIERLRMNGITHLKSKSFYPSTVVFMEGDVEPTLPPFPWIDVKPLKLKIMPWSVLFTPKAEVVRQVRIRLHDYEKRFTKKGYTERPAELRKHAKWWFQHYVMKKSPNNIADEQSTQTGSYCDAKNIAIAIKKIAAYLNIEESIKIKP